MSQSVTSTPAVPPLDADDQVTGLERAAGDRYRVYLDGTDRRRKLRYVAIARALNYRPYAVVTSDPAELLQALGCPDIAATAPPACRPMR